MDAIDRIKTNAESRLASTHIAGAELGDALRACRKAARSGWQVTLSRWENPSDPPKYTAFEYLIAARAIAHDQKGSALAIKYPALGYRTTLLIPLLEFARTAGLQLRFDAQHPEGAGRTLDTVEELHALHGNVWCTLPARWRRSFSDAERLARREIPVRIVRGQWTDSSVRDHGRRERFLELVQIFTGRKSPVSIATHDRSLARDALAMLRQSGTPCELEQLFGLPSIADGLSGLPGIPKRLYVPYGCGSLPYLGRDAWHRPSIVLWMIRDFLVGREGKLSQIC